MTSNQRNVSWVAQIVAALILLNPMIGKFTNDEMSIGVFQALGVEPWGRYATGVLELAAIVLLLVPKPYLGRHAWGAAVAAVVTAGALVSHATKLGFEGAAGSMAGLASLALIASLIVLYIRRGELQGS